MTHHSKNFSQLYDEVMYLPDTLFLKFRRSRLLKNLSGTVLEVGVGTGINFRHYGNNTTVIGIEPSPHMLAKAEKRKAALPFPNRFILHNIGCGYPEMKNLIEPKSLDAVVCTLVLCTVPEPEQAISNFMKWLKPGGGLLILEHIKAKHRMGAKLQDLFNPMWQKMAEGCQLNRTTDILIAESGFELVREEHFWLGMPFYEAEFKKPEKNTRFDILG